MRSTVSGASGNGAPSGVTAASGTLRPRGVPEYTMNVPSGDQTGFDDTELTSRTGRPPFAGTLNTRTPELSAAATAIHAPSGDHEGAPRTSSDSASGLTPDPSAAVQCSVERRSRRTGTHTRRPSGETAAAPTTAPWAGC